MRCHDLELFENLLSAEDRCGSLNEQAAKRENSVVFTRHSVRTPGDALGQSALTLAPAAGNREALRGRKKPYMQYSHFNLHFSPWCLHVHGAGAAREIEHAQGTFLVASITPSFMDATFSVHYLA